MELRGARRKAEQQAAAEAAAAQQAAAAAEAQQQQQQEQPGPPPPRHPAAAAAAAADAALANAAALAATTTTDEPGDDDDNGEPHHDHDQREDYQDHNETICGACGLGGELLCCEGCPAAFHAPCAGYSSTSDVPDAAWLCWFCALQAAAAVGASASQHPPPQHHQQRKQLLHDDADPSMGAGAGWQYASRFGPRRPLEGPFPEGRRLMLASDGGCVLYYEVQVMREHLPTPQEGGGSGVHYLEVRDVGGATASSDLELVRRRPWQSWERVERVPVASARWWQGSGDLRRCWTREEYGGFGWRPNARLYALADPARELLAAGAAEAAAGGGRGRGGGARVGGSRGGNGVGGRGRGRGRRAGEPSPPPLIDLVLPPRLAPLPRASPSSSASDGAEGAGRRRARRDGEGEEEEEEEAQQQQPRRKQPKHQPPQQPEEQQPVVKLSTQAAADLAIIVGTPGAGKQPGERGAVAGATPPTQPRPASVPAATERVADVGGLCLPLDDIFPGDTVDVRLPLLAEPGEEEQQEKTLPLGGWRRRATVVRRAPGSAAAEGGGRVLVRLLAAQAGRGEPAASPPQQRLVWTPLAVRACCPLASGSARPSSRQQRLLLPLVRRHRGSPAAAAVPASAVSPGSWVEVARSRREGDELIEEWVPARVLHAAAGASTPAAAASSSSPSSSWLLVQAAPPPEGDGAMWQVDGRALAYLRPPRPEGRVVVERAADGSSGGAGVASFASAAEAVARALAAA
jgi:hypothetical protein